MPSITTWFRLEPQTVTEDVATGYAARVHDPLWLLARQWQVGEFQGEDAGTPIVARWRARVAPMTRYVPGPIPPNTQLYAPRFDADAMPLETLVERQPLRQSALVDGVEGLRLAVESGQHFLRLLRLQATTQDHSAAFLRAYPVPALTDEQRAALDPDTRAYADLVAGRALDGRLLRAALGDPANPHVDPALHIAPLDRAEVVEASRAWLAWSSNLFSEPAAGDGTWQPDRMEYSFSMSTRLGDDVYGERTLTAEQYADGTLDWYAFDVNGEINMGTAHDPPGAITTRTVIPAPVTIHGMPSPRFWELEDARIDLGALQPGATDLPQLLLVETLSGYGNDWYVIPIDLPVGSLAESRSLVVTDTFGVQTLDPTHRRPRHRATRRVEHVLPLAAVRCCRRDRRPGHEPLLPPPTIRPLEGPVLEEVSLLRDELANIGWAVERGWRARWSWAWRPRWTWSTWRPHPGRQVTCRCTGWRRRSRSTGCRSSPCACRPTAPRSAWPAAPSSPSTARRMSSLPRPGCSTSATLPAGCSSARRRYPRGRRRPPHLPGSALARRPVVRLGRQPRVGRPRRSIERARVRRARGLRASGTRT